LDVISSLSYENVHSDKRGLSSDPQYTKFPINFISRFTRPILLPSPAYLPQNFANVHMQFIN
jgi:hypothetical protein